MDHPRRDLSQLQYVRAADVRGGDITLDGFEVQDALGSCLGRLAGLIIDATSERAQYVVVSAFCGIATEYGVLPLRAARLDARARVIVLIELAPAVSPPTSPPSCC